MRSRIVLFIALLAFGFGCYGLIDMITQTQQASPTTADQPAPVTKQFVAVWSLNRSLSRGEPISTSDVTKQQLVLKDALSYGIKEDTVIDFSPSTLLNRDLNKGEIILPEYQTPQGGAGYIDLLISEDMTIYPLQVSATNLVEDYIRPGVFVDVLTVSSPSSNLADNADHPSEFHGVKASLFLKHVKVLAIDYIDPESKTSSAKVIKPSQEAKAGYSTVVIEIHPEQLANIALAQRTMHMEVYRSQTYKKPVYAEVRNVITNYTGIEEYRGTNKTASTEGF
ncbi:Flp pilus assembly protein CpaB [Vibrio sp. Isolate33]|uniref:Flp pilus assembly protein CpaB n=1 Tax=Vibrio sp. Isolate33 TaxID=2908539 RepID=UPI001EFEDC1A|nr:Flp pilus assembly protein CpaB [Vibrio sp. Isolate33]MCG9543714.1 Flp pilus assembly protein CpaB [Vibrio sp. Isolate33]